MKIPDWVKDILLLCGFLFVFVGAYATWQLEARNSGKTFATGSDFPIGESLRQAAAPKDWIVVLPNASGYSLTSPYMIASGDRFDFLTDQNGTKVVVATMSWDSGIVRYEGPTDGPARVFLEALSGLIEQECRRSKRDGTRQGDAKVF